MWVSLSLTCHIKEHTHTHTLSLSPSLSLSVGGYQEKKKGEEEDKIENDTNQKKRWKQKMNTRIEYREWVQKMENENEYKPNSPQFSSFQFQSIIWKVVVKL